MSETCPVCEAVNCNLEAIAMDWLDFFIFHPKNGYSIQDGYSDIEKQQEYFFFEVYENGIICNFHDLSYSSWKLGENKIHFYYGKEADADIDESDSKKIAEKHTELIEQWFKEYSDSSKDHGFNFHARRM